jgi:hypothetical protein
MFPCGPEPTGPSSAFSPHTVKVTTVRAPHVWGSLSVSTARKLVSVPFGLSPEPYLSIVPKAIKLRPNHQVGT